MLRASRTSPRRKAALLGASGLVLLAGILLAAFLLRPASHAPVPEAASGPAVSTVRVRTGTVSESVTATGRVGPPAGSDAKLAFAQAGILASVSVQPGERVATGQTLAILDRRPLADALAQARADANAANATFAGGRSAAAAAASARAKDAAARAELRAMRAGGPAALSERISAVSTARQASLKADLDRRGLDRELALFAGGVVAEKDVEAARSAYASDLADERSAEAKVVAAGAAYAAALRQTAADAAAAGSDLASATAGVGTAAALRDSAAAKLAGAETDYARGVLAAPSDGFVISVMKHPGEAVDPTTPVIDVAPPVGDAATLALPSSAAASVRAGDPASLVLLPSGKRLPARVRAVVPAVDLATQTTTVVVEAPLADAVAGQALTATVVVSHTAGPLVPVTAIVTDPQTGKTVVFVRNRGSKDATFDSREVFVRANDSTSAIVAGVRPGEEIAAQGAYDLLAPNGGG